jgi:hypothetical protein
MTVVLKQFDTLDQLVTDKLGTQNIPDDFEMPEFPIPTEDVDSIDDILNLIQFLKDHKLDNICPKYRKLVDCEDIIADFNQMIGLKGPKSSIATQILSLCDRVAGKPKPPSKASKPTKSGSGAAAAPDEDEQEEPLLNTVFYGPPGCGKTTIANFLAKLYLKFGVLENGKIVKGDRSNMIGQYIGETAIKTKKILTQALGGILFIDEAYQLGHAVDGNRCPFAYECITTITQFITEHKGRITVMLAGYKKDVEENFFAQNEGLDRRFPWKYTLDRNKPEELFEIFNLQAKKSGYNLGEGSVDESLFSENKDLFKYSGGDTQTLFDKCKMVHDKRMFSCIKSDKSLSKVDLDKGFAIYKKIKDEHKGTGAEPPEGMYN